MVPSILQNVPDMLKGPKVAIPYYLYPSNLNELIESERAIPAGLSFEEVLNNKALPVRAFFSACITKLILS